jgi:effector-associated domain 8 (EAD8)-containing protein
MQFLEPNESSLLHSILVNHILIANETARADMLINCGLSSLTPTLSSLGRSSLLFVNELCARLSQPHIVARPSGQPSLVALLNYIALPPYDVDLTLEEKRFLEDVKQKCLQWYAAQIPK